MVALRSPYLRELGSLHVHPVERTLRFPDGHGPQPNQAINYLDAMFLALSRYQLDRLNA
jgi:hypothetical protein